jgi:predicted dinucleotide-binding enzyme
MRGSNRCRVKLQWRVKEAFTPVAIIGAGAVGATLGQAWLKHGQDVIWGLRNPADPKYAARPAALAPRAALQPPRCRAAI